MCRCLENDTLFLEIVNLDLFEGMEFSVEPLSNSFASCAIGKESSFSVGENEGKTHIHTHIYAHTQRKEG